MLLLLLGGAVSVLTSYTSVLPDSGVTMFVVCIYASAEVTCCVHCDCVTHSGDFDYACTLADSSADLVHVVGSCVGTNSECVMLSDSSFGTSVWLGLD